MRLRGLEHAIELRIEGCPPVLAIADEDLPRSNGEKTSAVYFLRFPLSAAHIAAWNAGAPITLTSTLPAMRVEVTLTGEQRCALAADFD